MPGDPVGTPARLATEDGKVPRLRRRVRLVRRSARSSAAGASTSGQVDAGKCKQATTHAAPFSAQSRSLTDDVIVVTPKSGFITDLAQGNGVSLVGSAEGADTIGIVLRNHTGGDLLVGARVFRYISFVDVG